MTHLHDLEQQIMKCWNITEDLDTLFGYVVNESIGAKIDADKVSNVLLGLKELYDLKFQELFDTYEAVIRETK